MSERGDFSGDMTRADTTLLDDDTAERLLRGLPVDTAPSSVRALGDVLRALRDRTPVIDSAGERAGVAAFLAGLAQDADVETAVVAPLAAPVVSLHDRRRPRNRMRFAAAAAVAGLTLLSGMAAVGALPGAAQTVAHDMLGTVGISVPEPASATDGHADTRGTDAGAGTNAPASSNGAAGATTTPVGSTATGGGAGSGNGVASSDTASDGKSQAGEHGPNAGTAPVDTPNPGGSQTADDASNGKSSPGTDIADSRSDGHSEAGSSNSEPGREHHP